MTALQPPHRHYFDFICTLGLSFIFPFTIDMDFDLFVFDFNDIVPNYSSAYYCVYLAEQFCYFNFTNQGLDTMDSTP